MEITHYTSQLAPWAAPRTSWCSSRCWSPFFVMMYRSSLKMVCLASQNGDNSSSPIRERCLSRARGRVSARQSEVPVVSLLFLPGQSAAGPLFRQLPPLGQYRRSSSCLGRAGEMLSMVECGSDGSMSFEVDAGMRERAETTMEETTSESRALEVRRSLGEIGFC
jgi:hypothetical protein